MRKGRGAVAAAKRGDGGAGTAAGGGGDVILTRDDLHDLKMEGRQVTDLMADRRLTRLTRFKHVDFGLLAPGDWWCDMTYTGTPLKLAGAMGASGVGGPQKKKGVRNTSAGHRRAATIANDHDIKLVALAKEAGAVFFDFQTGVRRVKQFLAWLALRPERHVSVVTDRQAIKAMLLLRHKRAEARAGSAKRKTTGEVIQNHDHVRDAAHDVEVLTDLLSEVYDCCQTCVRACLRARVLWCLRVCVHERAPAYVCVCV